MSGYHRPDGRAGRHAGADRGGCPYQFAGGFFMLLPSLIFIFLIRRYLFNMWGQVSK